MGADKGCVLQMEVCEGTAKAAARDPAVGAGGWGVEEEGRWCLGATKPTHHNC